MWKEKILPIVTSRFLGEISAYSWFFCPREDWQSDESSGRALEVNKQTSKMLLHVECVRVIIVWDMVRTPYTSQVLLLYVKPHKVG